MARHGEALLRGVSATLGAQDGEEAEIAVDGETVRLRVERRG